MNYHLEEKELTILRAQELLMGWSQAASELTEENERLKQGMRELQLDLDDAIKSRRDLQIKVESRDMQIGRYVQDNDGFKVSPAALSNACLGPFSDFPSFHRTAIHMSWS